MTHLDDILLNEYFDGVLDAPAHQAVEAHLAACAECRRQHAALHRVFGLLEALPDEPLTVNLQAAPPPAVPRWLMPLVVAQALAAVGLLVAAEPGRLAELGAGWHWLATSGGAWLEVQLLWLAQLGAPQMAAAQQALAGLTAWPQWLGPGWQWPVSSWALLAGSALAAWAAGLRWLLGNGHPYLPEGGHHGTDH